MRVTAIAALLLGACTESPPRREPDAYVSIPDGGTDAGPRECHVPDPDTNPADPPYGMRNGSSFLGITLNQCDGTPYPFYGPEHCDAAHRFTVLSITAGWCVPCQVESALLTEHVVDVYAPRGVRVVQIMVQDAGYEPPDRADCEAWVAAYGLTIPELLDPDQVTARYFLTTGLPATLVIDDHGTIVWHENGAPDGLTPLTDTLDALLE